MMGATVQDQNPRTKAKWRELVEKPKATTDTAMWRPGGGPKNNIRAYYGDFGRVQEADYGDLHGLFGVTKGVTEGPVYFVMKPSGGSKKKRLHSMQRISEPIKE